MSDPSLTTRTWTMRPLMSFHLVLYTSPAENLTLKETIFPTATLANSNPSLEGFEIGEDVPEEAILYMISPTNPSITIRRVVTRLSTSLLKGIQKKNKAQTA